MFRTLSRRVSLSFITWVVAMCALLSAIATWAAFSIIGAQFHLTTLNAARDLPDVVQHAVAAAGTLERARPVIEAHFVGTGAIVRLGLGLGRHEGPSAHGGRAPRDFFEPGRWSGALLVMSVSGARPVRVPIGKDFAFVGPDIERMNAAALSFLTAIGALVAVVIGVSLVVARLMARAAMKPLIEVTLGLRRLAEGEFTRHWVDTNERNPLGELATAYNGAVDQVTAAIEERLQTESEMRAFIADAGHELRTPLTVVTGYIDVLQKGAALDPDLSARVYASMIAESRRMRTLIDKLILLARLERLESQAPTTIDIAAFIARTVEALAPLGTGVDFVDRSHEHIVVTGDETELHAALSNLIENAIKYAPGAQVIVELLPAAAEVQIVVTDHGPGMSAPSLAHAFDRFYRGEDVSEQGSGLGLAIAKRAVERAHGTLLLSSEPGSGLRAAIRLPRTLR